MAYTNNPQYSSWADSYFWVCISSAIIQNQQHFQLFSNKIDLTNILFPVKGLRDVTTHSFTYPRYQMLEWYSLIQTSYILWCLNVAQKLYYIIITVFFLLPSELTKLLFFFPGTKNPLFFAAKRVWPAIFMHIHWLVIIFRAKINANTVKNHAYTYRQVGPQGSRAWKIFFFSSLFFLKSRKIKCLHGEHSVLFSSHTFCDALIEWALCFSLLHSDWVSHLLLSVNTDRAGLIAPSLLHTAWASILLLFVARSFSGWLLLSVSDRLSGHFAPLCFKQIEWAHRPSLSHSDWPGTLLLYVGLSRLFASLWYRQIERL